MILIGTQMKVLPFLKREKICEAANVLRLLEEPMLMKDKKDVNLLSDLTTFQHEPLKWKTCNGWNV